MPATTESVRCAKDAERAALYLAALLRHQVEVVHAVMLTAAYVTARMPTEPAAREPWEPDAA